MVLRGQGKHFCTGFDLSDLARESDDSLLVRFTEIEMLLQRVHRAPFATLAIAHGRTIGAGADLFAACRHRLVVPKTTFAFPGARGFGLVLGTRRLASLVGRQQAQKWIESVATFSAEDALAYGLATGEISATLTASELAGFAQAASELEDPLLRTALEGSPFDDDANDLAALVRSAARKGLKKRIERYIELSK